MKSGVSPDGTVGTVGVVGVPGRAGLTVASFHLQSARATQSADLKIETHGSGDAGVVLMDSSQLHCPIAVAGQA